MNKFRVLFIVNNKPQMMWVNNEQVISMMKKDPTITIYKNSNDQVAELNNDRLIWVDVENVEYKE